MNGKELAEFKEKFESIYNLSVITSEEYIDAFA